MNLLKILVGLPPIYMRTYNNREHSLFNVEDHYDCGGIILPNAIEPSTNMLLIDRGRLNVRPAVVNIHWSSEIYLVDQRSLQPHSLYMDIIDDVHR